MPGCCVRGMPWSPRPEISCGHSFNAPLTLRAPMPFATSVRSDRPESFQTPLLAVVVPEGRRPSSLDALDGAVGGAIARGYQSGDFRGKRDETLLLYPATGPARLLLIGIGSPGGSAAGALRRASAIAARRATQARVADAALLVVAEAR